MFKVIKLILLSVVNIDSRNTSMQAQPTYPNHPESVPANSLRDENLRGSHPKSTNPTAPMITPGIYMKNIGKTPPIPALLGVLYTPIIPDNANTNPRIANTIPKFFFILVVPY